MDWIRVAQNVFLDLVAIACVLGPLLAINHALTAHAARTQRREDEADRRGGRLAQTGGHDPDDDDTR